MCVNFETYWSHLQDDYTSFGGIKIFDTNFDKNNGYTIYENEKVKILMLRFDKISDFKTIIVNNTDYKNFRLGSSNVSNQKWYSQLYKKFKETLVIPTEMLDAILEHSPEKKNLEYFYEADYIINLKNYWYNKNQI